jgi:Ca2+-binding EF-hand superfamily protein
LKGIVFTDEEIESLFGLLNTDHHDGIDYNDFLSSFSVVHGDSLTL